MMETVTANHVAGAEGDARPSAEQARTIAINGMRDFIERVPPESAEEAITMALNTPETLVDSFIANMKEEGQTFPAGSVGGVLVGETTDQAADGELPLDDLAPSAAARACDHCGDTFAPRTKSGGKPQRFCSPECRASYHDSQRPQRGPTCEPPNALPAITGQSTPQTAQAGSPEGDGEEDFRWGSESTIIPEQQAVAVYLNPNDDLVIRQERAWDQAEDSFVFVCRENIDAFVDKLTDLLGYGSAGRR
jgi:hypothetical protein